jgi:ACS family hexuronate transporter-like MFS transporter
MIGPGLMYALGTDTFEPQEIATATGFAGMRGDLGGLSFSLIIGQLASRIGYEPLFARLSVFGITAFIIIALVLAERGDTAWRKPLSSDMPEVVAKG